LKLVLDVSNNRTIDVTRLKKSGAVWLIAKATEGTSFQDETLPAHRKCATLVDIPFGSYLFLHPDSHGSEAKYYLDYAKPKRGNSQPIIDAEVTDLTIVQLALRTQRCSLALESEGYDPILYASASIWKEMFKVEPKLKRLRVWEAQYPGSFSRWFPRIAKLRQRLRGARVVLWQWTDRYEVDGKFYDASALLAPLNSLLIGA
jgi:GH25 family lysozyme M1 (1,4-beta-N-acetylmuramidase)